MKFITIGEVLKPQGIKGAVKVRPITDNPKRFDALKSVYIDRIPYSVREVTYGGGDFVFLSVESITSRNAAEYLRGKLVEIERADAVEPAAGEYFISDIIGCALTDEKGKCLGKITAVDSFGAADVITGRTKKRNSVSRF